MRLLLLRHGEVASHRGDVPITPHGFEHARETGRRLGSELTGPEPMRLLSADTLRARQTIDAIHQGAVESAGEDRVLAPRLAFALRNPDLYLAGQRVDMVSTATALAEQVEGLDEDGCAEVPFFAGFLSAPERVGFWVTHASPPGEDAAAVAGRVTAFAASLRDFGERAPQLTVAATLSPVLRACGLAYFGDDPGEPGYVTGLEGFVDTSRRVTMRPVDPLASRRARNTLSRVTWDGSRQDSTP